MATADYYFNANGAVLWNKNPENMIDGSVATFAEEDGSVTISHELAGTNCDGTDLGAISKVELRAYGKGDVNGYRITLTPVFIPSGDGDSHEITMTTEGAWSDWIDITVDANSPVWDWDDVGSNLHCDVMNVETGCFCAKVEIRVTYGATFKRGWWSK